MDPLACFVPGAVVALQNKQTYELVSRLGRGAEGVVLLGKLIVTEGGDQPAVHAALKFLAPVPALSTERAAEARELAALALSGKLGERFVSGELTATADAGIEVHVMEHIGEGDLLRYARKQPEGRLDEWTLRPIMWDLATAIRDAKRMGSAIILDMKPENVLVLSDGGAKLCDVGCLVKVDDCGSTLHPDTLAHGGYTPAYAAPELMLTSSISTPGSTAIPRRTSLAPISLRPAVIYSLGVMCKALLGWGTGTGSGCEVSPELKDLLTMMTSPLPFNRPSIHRVLQHEWFHT